MAKRLYQRNRTEILRMLTQLSATAAISIERYFMQPTFSLRPVKCPLSLRLLRSTYENKNWTMVTSICQNWRLFTHTNSGQLTIFLWKLITHWPRRGTCQSRQQESSRTRSLNASKPLAHLPKADNWNNYRKTNSVEKDIKNRARISPSIDSQAWTDLQNLFIWAFTSQTRNSKVLGPFLPGDTCSLSEQPTWKTTPNSSSPVATYD